MARRLEWRFSLKFEYFLVMHSLTRHVHFHYHSTQEKHDMHANLYSVMLYTLCLHNLVPMLLFMSDSMLLGNETDKVLLMVAVGVGRGFVIYN